MTGLHHKGASNPERHLAASVEAYFLPADDCDASVVSTLSMAAAAREIAAHGLGIEIWPFEGSRAPFTAAALAELAEVCKRAPLATMHSGLEEWKPEALRREIDLAARLGVEILVVHCGTLGLIGREGDWPAIRDLAARARDGGFLLALENSGKIGIAPLRRALEVLGDGPAATGVGFCIDIGHAHRGHVLDGVPPVQYLDEFGRGIVELHLHDNFGTDDLHLVPGEGSLDWESVLPAMDALPPRTVFCLELKGTGHPLELIRRSRTFIVKGLETARGRRGDHHGHPKTHGAGSHLGKG